MTTNTEVKAGGRYSNLIKNPIPNTECHHLISRKALNDWCKYLGDDAPRWLTDPTQGWAPAIRMSTEDHAKTPSYYNTSTMSPADLKRASEYIEDQTYALIHGGIEACFQLEVHKLTVLFGDKYSTAINQAAAHFHTFLRLHAIPSPVEIELKQLNEQLDELKDMFIDLLEPTPRGRGRGRGRF